MDSGQISKNSEAFQRIFKDSRWISKISIGFSMDSQYFPTRFSMDSQQFSMNFQEFRKISNEFRTDFKEFRRFFKVSNGTENPNLAKSEYETCNFRGEYFTLPRVSA